MAKPNVTIVKEQPALLLGEPRADLIRVYAQDVQGNRHNIRIVETGEVVRETLIEATSDVHFEIAD